MQDATTGRRSEIPTISGPLLALFRHIVRRYFRRQFHAVRLARAHDVASISGPLIIYANHGSWWDPMVAYLLAERLFPYRRHFAPMDAAALTRYPVLRHLGVFPVELRTPRGAVQFLRTGHAILRSGGVLWVTPQGQFVDTRQRPLVFKPGLAALAARLGSCTVLPLAIEYTFWDERLPETLLLFGHPLRVSGETADALEPQLIAALESTMDDLKQRALTRSPEAFDQILSFNAGGAGGFYALGQRLRALVRRKPYQAEHTPSRQNGTVSP